MAALQPDARMSLGSRPSCWSRCCRRRSMPARTRSTPMRAAIWTVVCNVLLTIGLVTLPLWLETDVALAAHGGIALAHRRCPGIINAWLLWRYLQACRAVCGRSRVGARFLLQLALACVAMARGGAGAALGDRRLDRDRQPAASARCWLLAVIAAGAAQLRAGAAGAGPAPARSAPLIVRRAAPGYTGGSCMTCLFRDVAWRARCARRAAWSASVRSTACTWAIARWSAARSRARARWACRRWRCRSSRCRANCSPAARRRRG